jgi:hypothetical protein
MQVGRQTLGGRTTARPRALYAERRRYLPRGRRGCDGDGLATPRLTLHRMAPAQTWKCQEAAEAARARAIPAPFGPGSSMRGDLPCRRDSGRARRTARAESTDMCSEAYDRCHTRVCRPWARHNTRLERIGCQDRSRDPGHGSRGAIHRLRLTEVRAGRRWRRSSVSAARGRSVVAFGRAAPASTGASAGSGSAGIGVGTRSRCPADGLALA